MFDRETQIKFFHQEMIKTIMKNEDIQNMSDINRKLFIDSLKINSVDCTIDKKTSTKYTGSSNPFGFNENQTYTCTNFDNMMMRGLNTTSPNIPEESYMIPEESYIPSEEYVSEEIIGSEEIMFDRETMINSFHNEVVNGLMNNESIKNMSETNRKSFIDSIKINSVDCTIDNKEETKYIGSNNPFGLNNNQTYTCKQFDKIMMDAMNM